MDKIRGVIPVLVQVPADLLSEICEAFAPAEKLTWETVRFTEAERAAVLEGVRSYAANPTQFWTRPDPDGKIAVRKLTDAEVEASGAVLKFKRAPAILALTREALANRRAARTYTEGEIIEEAKRLTLSLKPKNEVSTKARRSKGAA